MGDELQGREAGVPLPSQGVGGAASLADVLHGFGAAVFEPNEKGGLRLLGRVPSWLRVLCDVSGEVGVEVDLAQNLPFLESFLLDAEEFWEAGVTGVLRSGLWSEEDADGKEWSLEATALCLEGARPALVVQSVEQRFLERRALLQQARRTTLDFERLRSEIQKKEVLLHCIVHDLKGPLSGMVGSMSLLNSRELDAETTQELLELGLDQARSQQTMIQGILDAFSAEVRALEEFETDPKLAPDLTACLKSVEEVYRAAYLQAEVELSFDIPDGLRDMALPVIGDRSRLERMLANLLENALRYSGSGKRVRVSVEQGEEDGGAEDELLVHVDDQGPGVPDELIPSLFDKFAQGKRAGGAAGLGLFFCRLTLGRWGGGVSYAPSELGGARFSLRLKKARS